MFRVARHNISFSSIFKHKNRNNIWEFFGQLLSDICKKNIYENIFLISCLIKNAIHRKNKHNFIGVFCLTDHKMTPKTNLRFRVISWKIRISRNSINFAENLIHLIISQHTITTIFDTIERAWQMESKTIFVMNIFAGRNVFSPRKFYFIAIILSLNGCNNWVKCGIFHLILNMKKRLLNLIFFDFQLFFVRNREPFTTSI